MTPPKWRFVSLSNYDEFNDLIQWDWQVGSVGVGSISDLYRQDMTEVVRVFPYWMLILSASCFGGSLLVMRLRQQQALLAKQSKAVAHGNGDGL